MHMTSPSIAGARGSPLEVPLAVVSSSLLEEGGFGLGPLGDRGTTLISALT